MAARVIWLLRRLKLLICSFLLGYNDDDNDDDDDDDRVVINHNKTATNN